MQGLPLRRWSNKQSASNMLCSLGARFASATGVWVTAEQVGSFWTCVAQARIPAVGVFAAKPVLTSDSVEDEMILMTPRVCLMWVSGLAVRFVFTDSERRPSGVIDRKSTRLNS